LVRDLTMAEGAAAPAPEAEVASRAEELAADVGDLAKDASDVAVAVANSGSDAANEVATDTAPAAPATTESMLYPHASPFKPS
jgi:hypothetical protein